MGSNGWLRSAINVDAAGRGRRGWNRRRVRRVQPERRRLAALYRNVLWSRRRVPRSFARARPTEPETPRIPASRSTFMIDSDRAGDHHQLAGGTEYLHTASLQVSFGGNGLALGPRERHRHARRRRSHQRADDSAADARRSAFTSSPCSASDRAGNTSLTTVTLHGRRDDRHADWRGEYVHRGRADRRIGWTEPLVEAPGRETAAVAR